MSYYVLIIESDFALRQSMRELFQSEGIEIVEQDDSSGGISAVMSRAPGIVLMSEDMQPLDGVELLPLLRRLTRSPIIVIGEGGETAVVKALLQGADMYLMRPINYRELLSRVRALLRRSEPDSAQESSQAQIVYGVRAWAARALGVGASLLRQLTDRVTRSAPVVRSAGA